MMLRSYAPALAGLAVSAGGALAQPMPGCLVIDDFTQGAFDESTRANGTADQLDADNALGGARRLDWTIFENPLNTRFNIQVAWQGVPGLAISMGSANATQVGLTYGGSGANPNFLPLNLNAPDLSLNAIQFDFASVDLDTRVAVELLDFDGGALAGRASISALVGAGLNQTLTLNFADFSLVGGFDFTEIDSVQVVFNSTRLPDRDLFVREIKFVPAPGAMALLGLGGLLAARRRR